ncbi:hypothetical protein LGM39_15120 [Burkholderia cepacia]|uniref:hypothetical protein n=1 Tax=Burkholderia cepacia TaxID=292 RepID=UPI001CF3C94D|nr:hypothetical protein [Burkholderia cepacia]MCA7900709.1 hypothetical protein [Burkholderia cepacia]
MNKTLTETQINWRWVEILVKTLSLEKPTTIGPRDAVCFVSALRALLAAQQPEPPTFEAKHVSLKQKGAKLILTLELDGVESALRYTVTPINPSVVRPKPEPRAEVTDDDAHLWRYIAQHAVDASAEVTDDDLTALLPGTHYMDAPDGGNVSLLEQLRRMAEDAARYRASRAFDDEAREFLYGNLETLESAIALADATGNCSQARGLEAVEYQIRRLFSAARAGDAS